MEKVKRKGQSRREFIAGSAVLGSVLAPGIASGATLDLPPPPAGVKKLKITKVEATHLVKPLKERFWMSLAPIGGYEPKATRLRTWFRTLAFGCILLLFWAVAPSSGAGYDNRLRLAIVGLVHGHVSGFMQENA